MDSRRCPRCETVKPVTEFSGKTNSYCKPCRNAYASVWVAANPGKVKAAKRRYVEANPDKVKVYHRQMALARRGLTLEGFEELFEAQGRRCAICRATESKGHGWHVDHDHSCCPHSYRNCSGCIRGILCSGCNLFLGQSCEDPVRIVAALRYLGYEVADVVVREGVDMVHAKKKSGDPDFDDKVPLVEQVLTTVKGPNGEDLVVSDALGTVTQAGGHASVDPVDVVDDRPDAKNADVPDDVVTADKAAADGDWRAAGGPIRTTGPTKTTVTTPAKSTTTTKTN